MRSVSRCIDCQSVAAEDPETVEQFRAVALAISEASTSLVDILAHTRQLNRTADEARGSVSGAEEAVDRALQLIDEAQQTLDDDGRRLLQEAMDEQREAGQQSEQLTQMALESRQTAEQYVLVHSHLVAVFNCWRPIVCCGWCSITEQSATRYCRVLSRLRREQKHFNVDSHILLFRLVFLDVIYK